MTKEDVPHVLRFTDSEGWGYDKRDIHRMVELSPKGCFVGVNDTEDEGILAMITTICYGSVGWIGNMLVHKGVRKMGIGKTLMDRGIEHIHSTGAPTVALHSYLESVGFYETQGFKRVESFTRFYLDNDVKGQVKIPAQVEKINDGTIKELVELDARSHGGDRSEMLKTTWSDFPDLAYVWCDGDSGVTGYALSRGSEKGYEIGPWICTPECTRPGALIDAVLSSFAGPAIEVSVRGSDKRAKAVLESRGFEEGYKTVTMHLGPPLEYPRPDDLWAIAALEKG